MMRTAFVVGSGRSGTSVLWRTINLDPDVGLAPETHYFDQWLPRYPDVTELWAAYRTSAHFASLDLPVEPEGFRSPRELFTALLDAYAAKTGASVRGDKTAAHFRHVGRLLNWFPEASVIFVLREPRSVVASLHAHDAPWANGSLVENIRLWNDATQAALRWKNDPRVTVVRYEDFVASPLDVLNRLQPSVAGHAFDPQWLDGGVTEPGARYASGSLRGGTAITTDRLQAWRDRLTDRQAAMVLRGCGHLMPSLGYEVDGNVASRSSYFRSKLSENLRRGGRAVRNPVRFAARLAYRVQGRRLSQG